MVDVEKNLIAAFDGLRTYGGAVDIREHIDTLLKYGKECDHITEFGVRGGNSTLCWVLANPRKIRCYDILPRPLDFWSQMEPFIEENGIDFDVEQADTREWDIEETDLLFIDTDHTRGCLTRELARSGNKARKYLIFHDTFYASECFDVVKEFCLANPHWRIKEHFENNNGLTVCERVDGNLPGESVPDSVTPTVSVGNGQESAR